MLYHGVWLIYNLIRYHGAYSLFWVAMSVWGIYRAWKWHRRKARR